MDKEGMLNVCIIQFMLKREYLVVSGSHVEPPYLAENIHSSL